MPWITEEGKNYWMPEVLPEATEEHQSIQSEKIYLTHEGKERRHPGWTYADNNAYVDDEYLFHNEGWKLVVDAEYVEPVSQPQKHYVKNSAEQWIEIDERTLKVTYTLSGWFPDTLPVSTSEYNETQILKHYLTSDGEEKLHPQWKYTQNGAYVDDEYLFHNKGWKLIVDDKPSIKLKHSNKNSSDDWEEIDERTVRVTYSFVDFTAEEVAEYEEKKWQQVRINRDAYLKETDWVFSRIVEENLVASSEIISFRKQLRDFPETITNIVEFDVDDDSLWPTKPDVYFED